MGFSDVWEAEILDHIFNIGAYTAPSIYVALSTADPLDDNSGIAEPSGGAYARVICSAWSRSSNEVDNDSAITFITATASWGTITHVALFDALTGGNLLASVALDASKAVGNGDSVKFLAGELNITLD